MQARRGRPTEAGKLAINKSMLQSLPAEIALFNNLSLIDLEENQLTALPDDCLPPSLKEAFFAKNRLTCLPNALVRCSGAGGARSACK